MNGENSLLNIYNVAIRIFLVLINNKASVKGFNFIGYLLLY